MNIPFNINEEVKVRLTSSGEQVRSSTGRKFPEIDADGYYTFQLHDLMGMFGEATKKSSLAMFEKNEIIFLGIDL